MPDRDDFFREYVFQRRPVVITGLFDGQAIATITSVEDALDAWGGMSLHLQDEYTQAEGANPPNEPVFMSFREYAAFTRSNPSTPLCCTEYDTPARVLASFDLPDVCRVTSAPADEIFGLPKKYGDFDLATNLFVANPGNVAHLHFDGDQREVLLHQVFGRKRVLLFPPSSAIHLRTLDGPFTRPSLAGLYLEDMGDDEKLEFVERAGGFHTVLEPGETISIPMLMWHHLEYLDDAMSFSIRYGRSRFGRFLAVDNFHRDPFVQNVASAMSGPEDVLSSFDPTMDLIKAEYLRSAANVHDKVRDMRALFRGLCDDLCPEADAEHLCPPEREEEQISRIVASNDMLGGMKYADPAQIARSRPVGPIAARQREIIVDGFRAAGYTPAVERSVLINKLGKSDLDQLTKAEAAQLIAYLRTAGAGW